MERQIIYLIVIVSYFTLTSLVNMWSAKKNKTSAGFLTAKNQLGPITIGLLLMSEFIGPVSTIGTAQGAYTKGLAVAWNSSLLGVGYILYAYLIAPRLNALGEYTISGALSRHYGNGVRYLVSLTMAFALVVVNVSAFTGGAATLASLVHIDVTTAVWIIGGIATVNVTVGGIHGTGKANLIHVTTKFLGLFLITATAVFMLMDKPELQKSITLDQFNLVKGIGYPTFFSWLLGNIGAVFATQYVLQAISSLSTPADAKKAAIIASITIFPIGFISAFIGIASSAIYPNIPSIKAFTAYFDVMNPWLVSIVASSLFAGTFVTILACQLGATALIMRDFVTPLMKPTEKQGLVYTRVISIIVGFLPIPCALLVPGLIKTIFFARSLRTAIAVLLIFMLFKPGMATPRGGVLGLGASIIATVAWFALGNPFGIDSMYVAVAVPIIIILAERLIVGDHREAGQNA